MPTAAQALKQHQPARLMVYGPPKSRKTWWACRIAEAGYRVFYIRGEDNIEILKQLTPAAQERIFMIDATDDAKQPCLYKLMVHLCKQEMITWDADVKSNSMSVRPGRPYIKVNFGAFGRDDVIVLDSWTALVWSCVLAYSEANGVDLADAKKTDWDGYLYLKNFLDWTINTLKSMPCHIVVICHEEVAEKKESITGADGKKESRTIWSRIQPKSSSIATGNQLAKHFTDVLYFILAGKETKINTEPAGARDGGSTHVEPKVWDWNQLGPEKFFPKLDKPSDPSSAYSDFFIEEKPKEVKPVTTPVPAAATGGSVEVKAAVPPPTLEPVQGSRIQLAIANAKGTNR